MKFYSKSGKIYNTMIGVLSENITSKVFPSKLKKDHESDVIYRRPIISERKVTVKYGENGDDIHSHIPLKNLFDHLSVYGEITIYDNKRTKYMNQIVIILLMKNILDAWSIVLV